MMYIQIDQAVRSKIQNGACSYILTHISVFLSNSIDKSKQNFVHKIVFMLH